MADSGFIGFIKGIFQPGQGASKTTREQTTGADSFDQVLRREVGAFGRGGDGDPLPEPTAAAPPEAASAEPGGPTPATESTRAAKKEGTKAKFFPLKGCRSSAPGAAMRAGGQPTYLPLERAAAYPLRVSSSVALNRFQHAVGTDLVEQNELGRLAAQFESGEEGIAAVGYDPGGGTSYGLYQIASRPGSMKAFIDYLEERQPDWARRLRTAGPANTGSTRGAMPRAWKRIAEENPERFEDLQRDFVRGYFHEPAAQAIFQDTGLDVTEHSAALQEVLWSTAVQHGVGGARKIFAQALKQLAGAGRAPTDEAMIDEVYRVRGRYTRGMNTRLRAGVQKRFRDEQRLALGMLRERRFRA